MLSSSGCFELQTQSTSVEEMSLNTLPYDLLLNVASYLDLHDVHALHLVSALSAFAIPLQSRWYGRMAAWAPAL